MTCLYSIIKVGRVNVMKIAARDINGELVRALKVFDEDEKKKFFDGAASL